MFQHLRLPAALLLDHLPLQFQLLPRHLLRLTLGLLLLPLQLQLLHKCDHAGVTEGLKV